MFFIEKLLIYVILNYGGGNPLSLNDYKDEAKRFIEKINANDDSITKLISMLETEFDILKRTAVEDEDKLRHQIYDMLFLLFEIASKYDMDLDKEWEKGRKKKKEKYGDNSEVVI